MKLFASLFLSVFLTAVSSNETNDITAARVVINGLQGDLTPEDVQLVHDTIAALTSPSVPYPQPALRANSGATTTTTSADEIQDAIASFISWRRRKPTPAPVRPSCGGWGCGGWDPNNPTHQRGRWYGYGGDYSCGPLCHNDDKFLLDAVVTSALIVSTIHDVGTNSVVEERLCETLRQQGSSALSQATKCSVTPMEAGPSVSSLCVDGSKVGEALVFVGGASMSPTPDDTDNDDNRSSMTDEEANALEKSVTAAYNAAYREVGLVLESFQALNMAVPPTTADNTTPSNDVSSAVIMGEFHQLCTDIDIDDKAQNDMDQLHRIFEILLCENLRDSGLPIFQQVKTCGYRTFHNHHASKSNVESAEYREVE